MTVPLIEIIQFIAFLSCKTLTASGNFDLCYATFNEVSEFLTYVCSSHYEAYFALLRVSEISVYIQEREKDDHNINFQDVVLSKNNGRSELLVTICSTKTDQTH